ncbi:hypothetical protein THAOC_15165, partial [Thalassiosira oceanica]
MVPPPPPAPPSAPDVGVLRSLARDAARALVAADRAGDALTHSYGSESQGLWVHGPSAGRLGETVGRVQVRRTGGAEARRGPGGCEGREGGVGRVGREVRDRMTWREGVTSAWACARMGTRRTSIIGGRSRRSGRSGGPRRRDVGLRMSEGDEHSEAPDRD